MSHVLCSICSGVVRGAVEHRDPRCSHMYHAACLLYFKPTCLLCLGYNPKTDAYRVGLTRAIYCYVTDVNHYIDTLGAYQAARWPAKPYFIGPMTSEQSGEYERANLRFSLAHYNRYRIICAAYAAVIALYALLIMTLIYLNQYSGDVISAIRGMFAMSLGFTLFSIVVGPIRHLSVAAVFAAIGWLMCSAYDVLFIIPVIYAVCAGCGGFIRDRLLDIHSE